MGWLTDRITQEKFALINRSKRFARAHVLPLLNDRILAPRGLRLTRSTPATPATIDFHLLLHGCRSALLRAMPKVSGTMLSAGCSGRWYFDWIAERTGNVGRHIGIELYSPKPDDLPANAEWIANSVGDMHGVSEGTCELVFSGQNIEHLWPEEILGFLLESWRVLRPDGYLIMDSPNRLLTEPFVWSHPEHIIEFTPEEIKRLLEMGGYTVSALKGMWLCRDPQTGKLLPLTTIGTDNIWSLYERLLLAEHDPDNSFLWWIEARKGDRPPDRNAMHAYITEIFNQAWPERCLRFSSGAGRIVTEGGSRIIMAGPSQSGTMVAGPYMPLKPGAHSATFTIGVADVLKNNVPVVCCEILGAGGREIMARYLTAQDIQLSGGTITLNFELSAMEFGIQARCISLGGVTVRCKCWPVLL